MTSIKGRPQVAASAPAITSTDFHLSNIFNNRNIRVDSINFIQASTTFITFINSNIVDFI